MTKEQLLDRVASRFGLAPQPSWTATIPQALAAMRDAHELSDRELSARIVDDVDLVREFAGCLTVGESYFLRHEEQYEIVLATLTERLRSSADAPLEVWSAGCSRGEEPLTLAILVAERLGERALERLRIVASDISRAALEKARRGIYHPWSLRKAPPWFSRGYFTTTPRGYYAVHESLLRRVQIEHVSVQERLSRIPARSVDVLFFRNVSIYLAPEATAAVYQGFHGVLKEDGMLFTAPADPAPPRALFTRGREDPVGGYRLQLELGDSSPTRPPPQELPSPSRAEPAAARPNARERERGSTREASRSGHAPRAVKRRALERQPLDQGPSSSAAQRDGCLDRGRELLGADRAEEAIVEFRRALFLNREDRIGRFWYAAALQQAGYPERARGQVAELSRQLAGLEADALLEDGETTTAVLLEAVHLMEASL